MDNLSLPILQQIELDQTSYGHVVVGFLTNGIGPNYPGWSGPNLIREVRLKLTKFVIKFALKVFTFSSGGHRSTL